MVNLAICHGENYIRLLLIMIIIVNLYWEYEIQLFCPSCSTQTKPATMTKFPGRKNPILLTRFCALILFIYANSGLSGDRD